MAESGAREMALDHCRLPGSSKAAGSFRVDSFPPRLSHFSKDLPYDVHW